MPKGFEESIRLKFYSTEAGSAAVPIKRVVWHDDSLLFEPPPVRSSKAAEFTCETRTRVERLLEAVYEDRVEIVGEVRSADVDQHNFAIRDATGAKVPAKFRPEHEAEITDALHDHASCRIAIVGSGEFSARDGSLRKIVRVDALQRRAASLEDEYDDSAPPLWQSVIDLGASLPPDDWDRLPTDLAGNLDHYLHGSSGEDE